MSAPRAQRSSGSSARARATAMPRTLFPVLKRLKASDSDSREISKQEMWAQVLAGALRKRRWVGERLETGSGHLDRG